MTSRNSLDRLKILQAATELANTEGYDAVTLATLAKKLQIRPPSLYNHVDGLQGIRNLLAIHGLEQLGAVLTEAAIGRSGDDAVHALGNAYVTFVRKQPGLYEASLRVPHSQEPSFLEASRKIVNLSLRVLQAYGLEDEIALHAVRGLRSILHGFASLEQLGGFGLPLDLDVSLRFMLDSYLAGLKKMKLGGYF